MSAIEPVSAEELEALQQATYCLERPLMGPIPDARVFHSYEPLPWARFLEGFREASRLTSGNRFLDVGCGIGTKLAFVHYLGKGWLVAGIDRHRPYIEKARELVPFADLTCADAFDVGRFDADLVFMYRPCVEDELERQLEEHVQAHMRPGSVLWLPTRPDPVRVI